MGREDLQELVFGSGPHERWVPSSVSRLSLGGHLDWLKLGQLQEKLLQMFMWIKAAAHIMGMLSSSLGKCWRESFLDSGKGFLSCVGSAQTVIHKGWITLHSHMKFPYEIPAASCPRPHHCSLLSAFWILAIQISGTFAHIRLFSPLSQVPPKWSLCPLCVLQVQIQGIIYLFIF